MEGLGGSLVSDTLNPVDSDAGGQPEPEPESGAAGGDDGNNKLVDVPDEFGRIGDWLSTPEGPKPLACVAYATLAVYPLWLGLIGIWPPVFPGGLVSAANGDMPNAILQGGGGLGLLLAGPAALHDLRRATAPDGTLAQLRAATTRVPRTKLEKLRRWRRVARVVAAWFGLMFVAGCAILKSLGLVDAMRLALSVLVWSWLFLPIFTAWWYSLKTAAVLSDTPVALARRAVRAEAKRMLESGATKIDADCWRTDVEAPVLRLGREVLPALSAGWGVSTAMVGVGFGVGAVSLITFQVIGGIFSGSTPLPARVFLFVCDAGLAAFPILLAYDPATTSRTCARLEDDLNGLCAMDLSFTRGLNLLKHMKALNKDQGLGFVSGGVVVTRRTLWLAVSAAYALTATVGPTLLADVGLEPTCGAQHAACPFGWMFADDACFKLFGDGVLPWAEAEAACLEKGEGAQLASVTSAERQRAVAHLSDLAGSRAWIGLNDIAREGVFVWSDGEPLAYTNWALDEPDSARPDSGISGDGVYILPRGGPEWTPHGTWSDHSASAPHDYICARPPTPVVASGGEMNGCVKGRWVMGTPFRQLDAFSYLPPTTVYGIYDQKVYEQLTPTKIDLNETATTPAECAALVHRDHRGATAAEYSNVGGEWCKAVFDA
eukprot:COSAG04_NODE_2610_length_3859_cov_11.192553_2_plen_660_part_00